MPKDNYTGLNNAILLQLDDDITLQPSHIRDYPGMIMTVASKTITFPAPARKFKGFWTSIYNGSSGNITIACTSGIFKSASSFTLATGAVCKVVLRRVTTNDSTGWQWTIEQSDTSAVDANPIATFTPTLTWTTANPTLTSEVYRKQLLGGRCFVDMYIAASADGGGATALTVAFPAGMVPANNSSETSLRALVSVNGAAYTEKVAILTCGGTPASNTLAVATGTLTDNQAMKIIIKGSYEVAAS